MDVMTRHQPFVVFGRRNAERIHSLDQAALHELDRLEGAIGLIGEDQRGVLQLAFTGG